MAKNNQDPFDRSIPGYTEVSVWPEAPGFPEEIKGIWVYRDGGTVGLTIKSQKGKGLDFFFDRVLCRLCYGMYETVDDAAYVKKGSIFEQEVFEYLEVARKRLSTHVFSKPEIQIFNQCLEKAKIYSDV
jgi:hypothetical protein